MARKITKSPPIQFRVPVALWPHLVKRAEKRNLTPSDYVRSIIVDACQKDADTATAQGRVEQASRTT